MSKRGKRSRTPKVQKPFIPANEDDIKWVERQLQTYVNIGTWARSGNALPEMPEWAMLFSESLELFADYAASMRTEPNQWSHAEINDVKQALRNARKGLDTWVENYSFEELVVMATAATPETAAS